jgi:hypothetical protein
MRRRSLKERVGLLANGEIGVFSLRPLTIHQERQKASYNIKLLPIKYVVQIFPKAPNAKLVNASPLRYSLRIHRRVYALLENYFWLYKKAKICEMAARVGGVEFGEEQANQRTGDGI